MGKETTSESSEKHVLASRIEALLFVSAGPVRVSQIAGTLETTPYQVENALEILRSSYENRGIRLQKHSDGFQLTTAPEMASDIERFLELEQTTRLSRAALEVLSIVAYQEPVTRPYIDSIRGVQSDSVLRTLLRYGLIEEAGRSDSPGRPILYKTTGEFLLNFGLTSLEELPPLGLDATTEIESVTQEEDERSDREGE